MHKESNNIKLVGIGLTRSVYLDGEQIMPPEGLKFDWGYNGSSTTILSKIILDHVFKDPKFTEEHTKEFTMIIVAILPPSNFSITLKLDKWLDWLSTPPVKSRHPYALIDLDYRCPEKQTEVVFSKWLDLPNSNIKSAVFKNDTIEYHELSNLNKKGSLNTLRSYYRYKTKTMDVHNTKATVHATIEYDSQGDYWVYQKGLGSIEGFIGHKATDYDF